MTQEQGINFMTAKEKQNFFSKEKKNLVFGNIFLFTALLFI